MWKNRRVNAAKLRSWLGPSDAIALLEITHECVTCRTEADFRSLFERLRKLFAFRHAFAMTGHVDARRGVVIARALNVDFPEAYLREYVARDYLRTDTVLKGALATGRVRYFSERDSSRPREIVSLNADFGMQDGYASGSRPRSKGAGSLVSLKGPSIRNERRTAAIVEFLTPHLHLALTRILDGERPAEAPVALSGREREVIAWLQHGKSSWEISVILGISESTVNFHVYNLIKKLGATNRPQALAIAARHGLLDG
jgi:DNA-binding CsgD family transcriptional regulator